MAGLQVKVDASFSPPLFPLTSLFQWLGLAFILFVATATIAIIGLDFRGNAGDVSPSIFRTGAFVSPYKNIKVAEDDV